MTITSLALIALPIIALCVVWPAATLWRWLHPPRRAASTEIAIWRPPVVRHRHVTTAILTAAAFAIPMALGARFEIAMVFGAAAFVALALAD